MIRASGDVAAVLQRYNVPSPQTPAQTLVTKTVAAIEDKITITPDSFRVTTSIEDYLPQARDLKKKSFKSVKEYAAYLLMLYAQIRDLKPKSGELDVKIEDKKELQQALNELDDVELV